MENEIINKDISKNHKNSFELCNIEEQQEDFLFSFDDLNKEMNKNKSKSNNISSIFLYVNPNSGSGVGRQILEFAEKENKSFYNSVYEFEINTSTQCLSVKVCNILNNESMIMLLFILKNEMKTSKLIIIKEKMLRLSLEVEMGQFYQ